MSRKDLTSISVSGCCFLLLGFSGANPENFGGEGKGFEKIESTMYKLTRF